MKISKDKTKGMFGMAFADRTVRYAYHGTGDVALVHFAARMPCEEKRSLVTQGVWRDSLLVLAATAENATPNTPQVDRR